MATTYRKQKVTDRVVARHYPFVVQIPVPDGGFASTLDAIKAWRCYGASMQKVGMHERPSDRNIGRWSFESMQIAEGFRLQFGGETDNANEQTISRASSQSDPARQRSDETYGQGARADMRRSRG